MTKYFGCILDQRSSTGNQTFFIFVAKAKDLASWVGVRRSHTSPEGVQRLLNKSRVRAISRFLEADKRNTIPNNILISIEEGKYTFNALSQIESITQQKTIPSAANQTSPPPTAESHADSANDMGFLTHTPCHWGFIDIDISGINQENNIYPSYVIDGQHRLLGVAAYSGEDIPLLIVAMLDASTEEQAFQFVVVNNKSVRVPTDNVKSIIADINEESLQQRLIASGITYGNRSPILREINDLDESPFFHLLDWDYNREGTRIIPLTAIEQCLRYARKTFGIDEENEDELFDVFTSLWRPVKKRYESIWGSENKLMTKVGMAALNELIVDSVAYSLGMDYLDDITDQEEVENQVERAIRNIPLEFWTMGWTIDKIQDNANVRELIKLDLDKIRLNKKNKVSWRKELKLIPQIDSDVVES